jgi:DNA-binding HxlR family transcriptional regulator
MKVNSSCTIQRVSSFISKQQKSLIFHEKHSIWREIIKENSSCTIQRVFSFISKQQKPLIFHEKHSADPEFG